MIFDIYILLAGLVLIDFISGTIAGILDDGFSSSKMREGLLHKLSYVLVIASCLIIEHLAEFDAINLQIGSGITLAACAWIAITEIGSILENVCIINPELSDNKFLSIFSRKD